MDSSINKGKIEAVEKVKEKKTGYRRAKKSRMPSKGLNVKLQEQCIYFQCLGLKIETKKIYRF